MASTPNEIHRLAAKSDVVSGLAEGITLLSSVGRRDDYFEQYTQDEALKRRISEIGYLPDEEPEFVILLGSRSTEMERLTELESRLEAIFSAATEVAERME